MFVAPLTSHVCIQNIFSAMQVVQLSMKLYFVEETKLETLVFVLIQDFVWLGHYFYLMLETIYHLGLQ